MVSSVANDTIAGGEEGAGWAAATAAVGAEPSRLAAFAMRRATEERGDLEAGDGALRLLAFARGLAGVAVAETAVARLRLAADPRVDDVVLGAGTGLAFALAAGFGFALARPARLFVVAVACSLVSAATSFPEADACRRRAGAGEVDFAFAVLRDGRVAVAGGTFPARVR